uniref:RRM domain-containing protein n=1 Tax=Electrophorus electricus TaxID=8005 RepID=A0AAY5EV07_ELEEL
MYKFQSKLCTVGRGLLAAAETLNFSMGESHSNPYSSSSQQLGGMGGLGGGDGQDHDSQLPRRVGSHLSNTMKLFASLGLSPTDLDVLAQVPEENISMETLPHLIMQLNRKVESSRHLAGDLPSHSPDTSYRGGRDDWGDMQGGRLDRSSGQSQSRASQSDFGYGSMQDVSTRSYDMLDYGGGGGGSSSRERQYSELSTDHYRGLGMASSSTSDGLFMQRRMGTPSQGKIQDFLGVMPHMFPHVCSLCDFDVHSAMVSSYSTCLLYPDWDPQMPSRWAGFLSLYAKGRSDGLQGAAPSGRLRQRKGMISNRGMTSKVQSCSVPPKIRSRVVVVKYDCKPVISTQFALADPFGTICKRIVLNNKALLELQTHEEAVALVNFYQKMPAILHGKEVQFYLSNEPLVIEKSDRPERASRNIKGANSQVVGFFVKRGQGRQDRDEVSLKSSSSSSTAKTLSSSQRSTSSIDRESSTEKAEEPKPEDVLAEGSGDEGEDVVEAAKEASQICNGEPAMNRSLDPEASVESEDSAAEPAEDRTHEAKSMEMPEEADLEQEVQSEKPAEPEADQEQEDFTEELKSGLRVVNVVGFKRSYGYLDEILALAKPFGKVVQHLVLDVRPEVELSSEQDAKTMVQFYSGNVIPSVHGETVKMYHSWTYPAIQVRNITHLSFEILTLAESSILDIFHTLKHQGEDAKKFAEACKENPPKFQGKRLVVYVSRKYKQLKHGYRPPSSEPEEKWTLKRERSEEEVKAQINIDRQVLSQRLHSFYPSQILTPSFFSNSN